MWFFSHGNFTAKAPHKTSIWLVAEQATTVHFGCSARWCARTRSSGGVPQAKLTNNAAECMGTTQSRESIPNASFFGQSVNSIPDKPITARPICKSGIQDTYPELTASSIAALRCSSQKGGNRTQRFPRYHLHQTRYPIPLTSSVAPPTQAASSTMLPACQFRHHH